MTPACGPGEDAKHSKIADFWWAETQGAPFGDSPEQRVMGTGDEGSGGQGGQSLILDCRLAAKIPNNFDLLERG